VEVGRERILSTDRVAVNAMMRGLDHFDQHGDNGFDLFGTGFAGH
jgi:hypothetical protein